VRVPVLTVFSRKVAVYVWAPEVPTVHGLGGGASGESHGPEAGRALEELHVAGDGLARRGDSGDQNGALADIKRGRGGREGRRGGERTS